MIDPWFIVIFLGGIVVGLLIGVFLASTLVKGHYTHFMNYSQPLRQSGPGSAHYSQYAGDPTYEGRRSYPRQ